MSIKTVRQIIAEVVTAVGLPCHQYDPDVVNAPCAILYPSSGDWNVALPRTSSHNKYQLVILIPDTLSHEESQAKLDSYIEGSEGAIIKDAIQEADYRGQVSFAKVIGWRDYGKLTLNYLSVTFEIETY